MFRYAFQGAQRCFPSFFFWIFGLKIKYTARRRNVTCRGRIDLCVRIHEHGDQSIPLSSLSIILTLRNTIIVDVARITHRQVNKRTIRLVDSRQVCEHRPMQQTHTA